MPDTWTRFGGTSAERLRFARYGLPRGLHDKVEILEWKQAIARRKRRARQVRAGFHLEPPPLPDGCLA
jgi:hypothetical protein